MINDKTLAEIRQETARAIQKHSKEHTPLVAANDQSGWNEDLDIAIRLWKLSVVTEEIGEVAKTINDFYLLQLPPDEFLAQLKKELCQVAATAAMWLESENGK